MSRSTLEELVHLSRDLGDPRNDYVILGEGNTSAREDDETFWVKASGTALAAADAGSFVQVKSRKILALLREHSPGDETVRRMLMDARIDRTTSKTPSVEAVLHAVCLELPGIHFVGHTHPTEVNSITCSSFFEKALDGRLFPDEIVVCGPSPLLIQYVDPGVPLALEIEGQVQAFLQNHGEPPRTIWMQNHGLVALGSTAHQVRNVTAMARKTARIIRGTYAMGGPHFLTASEVERIHTRPDEHYRKRLLDEKPIPPPDQE